MLQFKVQLEQVLCSITANINRASVGSPGTRMASAGDGAPTRGHVHRFTIPLAGVRPGQQITFRLMPPQVRKVLVRLWCT